MQLIEKIESFEDYKKALENINFFNATKLAIDFNSSLKSLSEIKTHLMGIAKYINQEFPKLSYDNKREGVLKQKNIIAIIQYINESAKEFIEMNERIAKEESDIYDKLVKLHDSIKF